MGLIQVIPSPEFTDSDTAPGIEPVLNRYGYILGLVEIRYGSISGAVGKIGCSLVCTGYTVSAIKLVRWMTVRGCVVGIGCVVRIGCVVGIGCVAGIGYVVGIWCVLGIGYVVGIECVVGIGYVVGIGCVVGIA